MRRLQVIISLFILVLAFGLLTGSSLAQSGGQFCVRAFEDRNGNQQRDGGEPALTRGISVNLMDATGITIASALLDDSPTAVQGVICFQFLQAGQYSLNITSADFTPTTTDQITAAITADSVELVDFGAQRVAVASASTVPSAAQSAESEREQLIRLVLSALGSLLMVAAMIVFGVFIYLIAFRGRTTPVPVAATDPRRTTGSVAAVRTRDTSEHPRVQ